ncbi:mitogen-activated protein kinase kinase kinase A-like [Physella acuta]|uniref:mitogen-activated protein kinase kinase kinase A-like n=1 Tax=Physella acuta TaxID=109671 RepID=UPI0027DC3F0B|nr:mitogen-activated protein kinase kinase kinase A-like [Physella acuta]
MKHSGPFYGDGEDRSSNWRKGKCLGRGNGTTVYQVGETKYAAKQFSISDDTPTELVKSVMNEIKGLEKVRHDRIIKLYGYSKTDHTISLFMECMLKGSLATYIKNQPGGFLSEEKTLTFTHQILEALIYLHDMRIIHRDIKGSNILMEDEFNIKLADFGHSEMFQTLSIAGTDPKGTYNWMAPELFQEVKHSYEVDIWSLGCTIYQMGTGKIPFQSLAVHKFPIAAKERKLEITLPETFPQKLKDLIFYACKIEPTDRPTARELKKKLLTLGKSQQDEIDISLITGTVLNGSDSSSSEDIVEKGYSFLNSDFFNPQFQDFLNVVNVSGDEYSDTPEENVYDEYNYSVKDNTLLKHYKDIVDEVDTRRVVHYLLGDRVITEVEMKEIEAETTKTKRTEKLLQIIMANNPQSHCDHFIKALELAGYKPLAKKIRGTEDLQNNMKSLKLWSTVLTETDASRYASALGKDWDDLFLHLGFTKNEIDVELKACRKNEKRTITNLLIKWIHREGKQATHGKFLETLNTTIEYSKIEIDLEHVSRVFRKYS